MSLLHGISVWLYVANPPKSVSVNHKTVWVRYLPVYLSSSGSIGSCGSGNGTSLDWACSFASCCCSFESWPRKFGWRSCSGIKFDFLSCFYDVVVHIIFLGNIIAFGGCEWPATVGNTHANINTKGFPAGRYSVTRGLVLFTFLSLVLKLWVLSIYWSRKHQPRK